MDGLILMAEPRTVVGKKVKQLRRVGLVPGVVYGPGLSGGGTVQVSVQRRDFERFYMAHGHSTLFTLQWDGGSQQVFIREVQEEPVKRMPLHVDFFSPNLREALIASVQVVLRHADERHAGILTQVRADIEVSALPRDFPQEINADASHLSAVGDALRVSDLTLPPGVTAVTSADEVVAMITPGSVEEPAEGTEGAPEAEAPAGEAGAAEATDES
ncbi:MAG: large subunit ribosomal protein [Thermomicrobiales bacterium]|jgi:large subunit ribosomal protein L25|nr:large subunit ribosomal protein [Thermomicrobiales bacterium]MEA2597741.1 large subunit ribosomal protein [Thermomicrobiales bacterium]